MIKKILPLLVLLLALGAGIFLVKQVTEIRRGAAGEKVDFSILPSEKNVAQGETIEARVVINSGETKIDGIDLKLSIQAENETVYWDETEIFFSIGPDQAFTRKVEAKVLSLECNDSDCSQVIKIALINLNSASELKKGVVEVARLQIKTKSEGKIEVKLIKESDLKVTGVDASGQESVQLAPDLIQGAVYNVAGGVSERKVDLIWEPVYDSDLVLNQSFEAKLKFASEHKIDGVNLEIKLTPSVRLEVESVEIDSQEWGNEENPPFIIAEKFNQDQGIIALAVGAGHPDFAKKEIKLGTIKFKPSSIGSVGLEVIKSDISGYNPDDPANSALNLINGRSIKWTITGGGQISPTAALTPATAPTLVPTLTPTLAPGTPILNFKVSFIGVSESSEVKENPGVLVKVRKDFGPFFEFPNVQLEPDQGNKFKGRVALTGVAPGEIYSIFIKGPKHLARKFCQNNQTERCFGRGEITLAAGNNFFDFSQLGLEPGDLPNPEEGMKQDGLVSSADLALIKARFFADDDRQRFAIADLDFNQTINSRDIVLFLQTLSTKYGEED